MSELSVHTGTLQICRDVQTSDRFSSHRRDRLTNTLGFAPRANYCGRVAVRTRVTGSSTSFVLESSDVAQVAAVVCVEGAELAFDLKKEEIK